MNSESSRRRFLTARWSTTTHFRLKSNPDPHNQLQVATAGCATPLIIIMAGAGQKLVISKTRGRRKDRESN